MEGSFGFLSVAKASTEMINYLYEAEYRHFSEYVEELGVDTALDILNQGDHIFLFVLIAKNNGNIKKVLKEIEDYMEEK